MNTSSMITVYENVRLLYTIEALGGFFFGYRDIGKKLKGYGIFL